MKNNDNRFENLKSLFQLVLVLLSGAAFSAFFIYMMFKDNEIAKLLFSANLNASAITLLFSAWVLGGIVGAIITALPLLSIIVERNEELKDAKEKNKTLRERLGKIDKRYTKSPSSRIFDAISDVDCSRSTDNVENTFATLQEQLRTKSKKQ